MGEGGGVWEVLPAQALCTENAAATASAATAIADSSVESLGSSVGEESLAQ